MDIHEFKALLSRFNVKPNKILGQNFLLSETVLDQIIAAANITKTDNILEIGPGLGFLTKRLADIARRVVAIEKDRKLCLALRKIFKNKKNVRIINADILRVQRSEIRGQMSDNVNQISAIRRPGSDLRVPEYGYKVVANIPYYLTGKILQEFLAPSLRVREGRGELRRPLLMVLLLQQEVAWRIVAKPGDMSLLALSVQFYADPEIIAYVGKENFYPIPEVDSAIVRITPHPNPLSMGEGGHPRWTDEGINEAKFFELLKIAFSNKRKQLHNNLRSLPTEKPWIPNRVGNDRKVDYKILLSSLGLNPLCRAQDLSLEDWTRLYKKLFDN